MDGCYSAGLHSSSGAPVFLLDCFRSAYNVGSAFRTAEAIAPCHVFLSGCCARPGGARLAHTARGTQDIVLWRYFTKPGEAADWIRNTGRKLVALEPSPDSPDLFSANFGIHDAFVFGNEALGISREVLAMADSKICVPQTGRRNCINVASTIAAVAMEIQRRRFLQGFRAPAPGWSREPDEEDEP
jgi:23S rRNA (guanosine2251-2'-O)-methyltransferase